MDCADQGNDEHARFGARTVSTAFHLAVIEQALGFIGEQLDCETTLLTPDCSGELRAVCDEALEALANLKASFSRLA